MAEYVSKSTLYALCGQRGITYMHVSDIDNMPAADVAPVVHGKWVYNKNATDWGIGGYVCSEGQNKNNNLPCNRAKSVRMFSGAKYCPEFGAKMYEEQEEPTNEKQHDAE